MIAVGRIMIYLGLVLMGIGTYGVYRFKSFYTRALVSAKVDIVGEITIILGIIISKGLTIFTLKLVLILLILLVINPLNSHMLVRSAVNSGYKIRKE